MIALGAPCFIVKPLSIDWTLVRMDSREWIVLDLEPQARISSLIVFIFVNICSLFHILLVHFSPKIILDEIHYSGPHKLKATNLRGSVVLFYLGLGALSSWSLHRSQTFGHPYKQPI